jgi:hypothetical protein
VARDPALPALKAPLVLAALVTLGSAACASAPPAPDVPALLASPTPEVRTELLRAVREALGGAAVTLADDAFTRESTLVVERSLIRGPDGTRAQGRETGRPDHFRLVKSGGRCVLIHEESDRRFPLSGTSCAGK